MHSQIYTGVNKYEDCMFPPEYGLSWQGVTPPFTHSVLLSPWSTSCRTQSRQRWYILSHVPEILPYLFVIFSGPVDVGRISILPWYVPITLSWYLYLKASFPSVRPRISLHNTEGQPSGGNLLGGTLDRFHFKDHVPSLYVWPHTRARGHRWVADDSCLLAHTAKRWRSALFHDGILFKQTRRSVKSVPVYGFKVFELTLIWPLRSSPLSRISPKTLIPC